MIWTDKLLVGTYTAQGNTAMAQQILARIPQNTAENLEFHQLYEAVWNGQVHQVENIATNFVSSNAALAQAHLAVLRGDIYQRKSMPLLEVHNGSKRNLDEFAEQQSFGIYPNPSNTSISVNWEGIDKVLFHIYTLNGEKVISKQLSKNENIVNIQNLSVGIYYCRIENNNIVQKLVIIQ
ncbi:MAG: T9SS type A sorting domain-containing protein [Chitinophagales bacterium]